MQTAEITQALRSDESKQVRIMDAPVAATIDTQQTSETGPTQTVSSTTRNRIETQGFLGLSDETLRQVGPWLRLAPGICAAWVAVGTILGSAWVLWALVPFAVAGAIMSGHPFDVLYNYGARFLTGGPRLPKYGAPKHFACAVGAAWVASTGAAFYFGQAYLGYALGGSMVVAAALPAITDFCIPSFVWGLVFGKPRCPLVGEG